MPNLSQFEAAWEKSRNTPAIPDPLTIKPGIHFDIPFEDYCRIPAVNKSSLCEAKRSLAHYKWAPRPDETPAFRMGSLVHTGKLEPEELAKRYVVIPDAKLIEQTQQYAAQQGNPPYKSPKATKVFKELVRRFLESHPGKQEVSEVWFDNLAGMLRSLEEDELAVELFETGHPEVTIVWSQPTGNPNNPYLLCKGRIDWLTADGHLVDLKTAVDPLEWTIDKYDYHIQAASYLEGYRHAYTQMSPAVRRNWPKSLKPFTGTGKKKHLRPLRFFFVGVEKTQPWTVLSAAASANAVRIGLEEYQFLLSQIAEAEYLRANGTGMRIAWPMANPPAQWEMSRWYREGEYPLRTDHPE